MIFREKVLYFIFAHPVYTRHVLKSNKAKTLIIPKFKQAQNPHHLKI
jgi:hypothetical protein